MLKAKNLGLENFNLVVKLRERLSYQNILLNNDAKCAAMCEKEYGSLKQYDDAIFLCLGTGIGGAVFIGGKMLRPKRQSGFEMRTCSYSKKW